MTGHAMTMRYRIERHERTEGAAPTIDEANTWIRERIKRAGRVGLRLRPLDFNVIDTWGHEEDGNG